jgi:hypothetical protein
MPGKSWLNESAKMAIVADKAAGIPIRVISERYRVDPSTIWRLSKKLQRAHPESSITRGSTSENLKARLTAKAYNALESGLDSVDDPYRRGALGHQTLKEMGSLAELGANNASEREFLRQVAALPEATQMRYLNPPADPEPRILSPEDHEVWALDVFRESGMSAVQFSRERESARRGERRLITGSEEVEEFFRAEQVRAGLRRN